MMLTLLKFFKLSLNEKILFINTLFLLTYCRFNLKKKPLHLLFAEVEKKSLQKSYFHTSHITAKKISQLITAASQYLPFTTCLTMALAGKILFSRCGYKVILHIGVSKECDYSFEAHAWLTLNDELILCYLPDIAKYKKLPIHIPC